MRSLNPRHFLSRSGGEMRFGVVHSVTFHGAFHDRKKRLVAAPPGYYDGICGNAPFRKYSLSPKLDWCAPNGGLYGLSQPPKAVR